MMTGSSTIFVFIFNFPDNDHSTGIENCQFVGQYHWNSFHWSSPVSSIDNYLELDLKCFRNKQSANFLRESSAEGRTSEKWVIAFLKKTKVSTLEDWMLLVAGQKCQVTLNWAQISIIKVIKKLEDYKPAAKLQNLLKTFTSRAKQRNLLRRGYPLQLATNYLCSACSACTSELNI